MRSIVSRSVALAEIARLKSRSSYDADAAEASAVAHGRERRLGDEFTRLASLVPAGCLRFLTSIQSFDRQGRSARFDTIPSSPTHPAI